MTTADFARQQEEERQAAAQRAAQEREREEQAFWDRAFCAVLAAGIERGWSKFIKDQFPGVDDSGMADLMSQKAAQIVDAALAARRQRMGGDDQ